MTRQTKETPVVRVAETGWAKARHMKGKGVRTCVPAVADANAVPGARTGMDGNIVRGED